MADTPSNQSDAPSNLTSAHSFSHRKKLQEIIHRQAKPYFDSMLNAIHQAQFSLDMEVYIFDVDPIGEQFADALKQAAQRGVWVRLLVDGMGISLNFIHAAKQLREAGVHIHIHHPLPWRYKEWSFALTSIKGIQKFFYLLGYINQRNHRKLLIVDQKSVWLGSFNISRKHLPKQQGGQGWFDTAIELHHLNTRAIRTAFNISWNKWKRKSRKQLSKVATPSPFLLNFTRSLRQAQRKGLLDRIEHASNHIWITNAYFIPDTKLLNALILASRKGVDVRIVLPYQSDVFFMPWASSFFYEQLLQAGARVYEFQAGILHSKTLIIDDWASIGSSNFNRRSLEHDLEVDYTLQLTESIDQLEHDFLEDLTHSEELCQYELSVKKPWQRFIGGLILLLFSYWL